MCRYCKDYSIESTLLRSNCNPLSELFTSLIADTGNGGKELVVSHQGKAFGIPLNFCPFCGEKIKGNESYIENYNDEVWHEELLRQ